MCHGKRFSMPMTLFSETARIKIICSKNQYLNISFLKKNVDTLSKISEKLISEEGDKGGWEGKEKYFKPGKKFEEGADRLGGLINKHNLFLKVIYLFEDQ